MPDYRPILKHYYKLNERKCYEAVYSKERLSVIPHQCSNNKKLASWGKIIIQFIKICPRWYFFWANGWIKSS